MTNFCAIRDKKLMMNKAGELTAKGFSLISRVWKKAVLGCALAGVFAGSAMAYGDNDHVKNIQYVYHQNDIFNPAFKLAWDVMEPIYKGSVYERGVINPLNPLIGIGEEDLNGDNLPEIIAFPTETEEETGQFCKKVISCPHYVLQVRGKQVKTLGIIYADSLDVGNDIHGGYWTLKAYTRETEETDKDHFDTYGYDKKTDRYIKLAPKPAAAKP